MVVSAEQPVRRPRLQDVATEAGVSTASASLVLRGAPGPSAATRERVLEAAARLGYRPDRAASSLARRRSRLIGIVMDVGNTFHAQLVEDVHEAADEHGYDLVLSTVTRTRDENRAVETLLDSRCEALVLLGSEAPAARLSALDRQLPVVAVGRPVPSAGVDVVRAADDEGVALAVDHLVGLGHRRIAHIEGARSTTAHYRRTGYEKAMHRHGLSAEIVVEPGDFTEDGGYRAAGALLRRDARPTAIFAPNDLVATGALSAADELGMTVPADLSIVGYDNTHLAAIRHISLTSVDQPRRDMGRVAAELLTARIGDPSRHPRQNLVVPHLVVRSTTGPAPAP